MQAGALPFRRCGRGCVCGTNMLKAALATVSGLKFYGQSLPGRRCFLQGIACLVALAHPADLGQGKERR